MKHAPCSLTSCRDLLVRWQWLHSRVWKVHWHSLWGQPFWHRCGCLALLCASVCALRYCHLPQEGTMCSPWNAPGRLGPSVFQTQQQLLLGSAGETSQHCSWSRSHLEFPSWFSVEGADCPPLWIAVHTESRPAPAWESCQSSAARRTPGLLCGHPLPSVWEAYCECGSKVVEPGKSFTVFSLNH